MTDDVLDNPALSSLIGPHARFAIRRGQVLRYPADVCPFAACPADADPSVWDDVAALFGPGTVVPFAGSWPPAPDWRVGFELPGVQLTAKSIDERVDTAEIIRLGADDVPEMLALVALTQPGPFLPRTIEMGTYLGIRRDGKLVAMAGERLHPPGWTEVSGVCTHPDFRGQGLAGRLVQAVSAGIRERGETAFLHSAANNTSAIRLYQALGFTIRREVTFFGPQVPA